MGCRLGPACPWQKKPRSFERGSVSQARGTRLRMVLRILDVPVSLFGGLLGFQLRICLRAQRLDGLTQAQRFAPGSSRAAGSLGGRLASHAGLHAGEADSQVFTNMSGCDALTHVLESGAGLLCR